ncbi:MAG: FmdB family zinc ribbon protein [Terracidiphilus sp.]
MPLYAYRCTQCGHRFEKIQSFAATPESVCPKCGGVLERPITAPALSFKGAGWYVNDYAGKSSAPAAESSTDSKKDSPATESNADSSKTAAPAETKSSTSSSESSSSAPASTPSSTPSSTT